MTSHAYRPDYPVFSGIVARDVAVSGEGEPLTLTCRWPEGKAPKAFVVFCHGLGATGRNYAALSEHWATHGYLVIHPTFADSIYAVAAAEPGLGLDPQADLSKWVMLPEARKRMHEILLTPSYWTDRIRIVSTLMDRLDTIFASTCGGPDRPIPGAIAGHSFGAYTAQLLAGAEIDVPGEGIGRFWDERFSAALLLSAQGRDQQGLRGGSWDGLTGPVLTVTGTLDQGAGGQGWEWKSEPYELGPAGDKYLAILDDTDHYLGLALPDKGNPRQRDAVCQLTTAFLDAHLMDDEAARSWLTSVSGRIDECRVVFKRK